MEEGVKKWIQEQQDKYHKVPGVEYDVNVRWEKGIPHHPRSISLYKKIAQLDFIFADDHFRWRSGGDGNNGECLMYLMDIIFEEKDKMVQFSIDDAGAW